jgi:ParB-like chromosome segregation protein Spo0J
MTDRNKTISRITLAGINVGVNPLRPLIDDEVKRLAVSIQQIGMLTPITVRYQEHIPSADSDDSYELVTGRHRVAAALSLGWDEIDAIEIECSDVDAKLWEIAENVHRAELTRLQHDEQVAMWIKLTDEKELSTQVAPKPSKPKGGRPAGGVRAASRDLGIDRDAANRAIKVASLSDEAKDAAREHGLDDNRTALLEAAREIEPAAQVATIVERATRTAKPLTTLENNADRRDKKNDKKSPDALFESLAATGNRVEETPTASKATKPEEARIEQITAESFVPRTPAKFREAKNQIAMAETTPEAFWAEASREMAFWGFAYESAVLLLDSAILKLAAIKTRQPDASPPVGVPGENSATHRVAKTILI